MHSFVLPISNVLIELLITLVTKLELPFNAFVHIIIKSIFLTKILRSKTFNTMSGFDKHYVINMKSLIYLPILFLCFAVKAQVSEPLLALNNGNSVEKPNISATKKQFSGSESSNYSFVVNSNVKENTIHISTNYLGKYKIRFLGYYGGSRKVYKDVFSNKLIDISEFEKEIFIMNITDARNNKLLSSQVINLKRRHL